MLHQMTTASSARAGEFATIARPPEGRPWTDSDAWEEPADDTDLPQCKIKRNYNCAKCTFYTQNPRAFLQHSRDVHFEKFKIYDCSFCVYASRHHQKLIRHMKMVHSGDENNTKTDTEPPPILIENVNTTADPSAVSEESAPQDFEDMLEEVEDSDPEEDNKLAEQFNSVSGQTSSCFCCNKCNYVTHIRSRFTKHVRYHTMPLIKCTICDFRTPYKWNLDRHMKNHGGTGCFHCSMCNFTADIKQSLTVHEMNHHVPAVGTVGQSAVGRRRNRVGASDATNALIAKEEEGSGDSRSSHTALPDNMNALEADVELVSCNSESNDASAMDVSQLSNDASYLDATNSDETKNNKQSKKPPRPIPQLIPLNTSTPGPGPSKPPSSGEPPSKKFKDISGSATSLDNLPSDTSITPITQNTVPVPKETPARKKNNSFFDKLKERLLTETGEEGTLTCKNCGFESKCLSEHSVHEKNCNPAPIKVQASASNTSLSSTRCQNCRHRCKSSADLYVHLQTCGKSNNKDSENADAQQKTNDQSCKIGLKQDDDEMSAPHPMENVVFVWNNISDNSNKFEMPLDISINDDCTLPEISHSYDPDNTEDNDGMILSPTQAIGKKVFKCPQCPFWASTASRFHVHIVGHLNKKPFECSLCKYKSNWRWDITKHIKLKSARDPEHNQAKVLMTDETGRRNYSKYNKFLAMPVVTEAGISELIYVDQDAANNCSSMDIDESPNDTLNHSNELQPLDLHTQHIDNDDGDKTTKPKKTLWKCKKCNYKDPLKAALLDHVRVCNGVNEEPKPQNGKLESSRDPSDLAYRCGHCNQLSNWKHVIQRHCRLKHEGNIKVVAIERPKQDTLQSEITTDFCPKCPFKSSDRKQLAMHLQQHTPSPQSIFKCYFCPYYVKNEVDLVQHLTLHGVSDPDEYIAKAMGGKSPVSEPSPASGTTKRHKCTECPYETNSRSQFMYHEQFHRLPADTPYKCQECNYSVSKRHLLHQHMRVHGIMPKKNECDQETEASTSSTPDIKSEQYGSPEEIPYVWVSAKNEFHKMYKCRYCSYVNSQKCKLPNHEKIHCITFDNRDATFYKCLECKFTCDNAGRLSQHSKTHGEMYGRIYCAVDLDIPDEEQIQKLRKQIEEEKIAITEGLLKDEAHLKETDEYKQLFFCQKCPARFFSEGELSSHESFHDQTYPFKCKSCEYSVPIENQLNAHLIVHTDIYQSKTKLLKMVHETHPNYKDPSSESIYSNSTADKTWDISLINKVEAISTKKSNESKHTPKQYFCKECPAKFFKNSALTYHMGLHGSEGEYKCKFCSYAVKNVGNLAKHELLHDNEGKTQTCNYESGDDNYYKNVPLSGTDLFQRKTEAQKRSHDKTELVRPNDHFPPVLQADPQFGYLMHGNPEFIYPTYLKNGRQREKRYKCHKCPSAFEKREQYKIHLSLHGSKQRYKCELCDYSVKYYANYVQHMRKHQMNDDAKAERKRGTDAFDETESQEDAQEDSVDNIKLAIKTMPKGVPKSDFQLFSVSDQQTLRLLQRRRSIENTNKELLITESPPAKDRKLHMCTLCPYTNQRQDALHNHYKRHDNNDAVNVGYNKCPHCDLVVVQSNFLRDHIKAHFIYQKHLTPQCFVANEEVGFTILDEDDENVSNNLILELGPDISKSQQDKILVKISSGEIVVE